MARGNNGNPTEEQTQVAASRTANARKELYIKAARVLEAHPNARVAVQDSLADAKKSLGEEDIRQSISGSRYPESEINMENFVTRETKEDGSTVTQLKEEGRKEIEKLTRVLIGSMLLAGELHYESHSICKNCGGKIQTETKDNKTIYSCLTCAISTGKSSHDILGDFKIVSAASFVDENGGREYSLTERSQEEVLERKAENRTQRSAQAEENSKRLREESIEHVRSGSASNAAMIERGFMALYEDEHGSEEARVMHFGSPSTRWSLALENKLITPEQYDAGAAANTGRWNYTGD